MFLELVDKDTAAAVLSGIKKLPGQDQTPEVSQVREARLELACP